MNVLHPVHPAIRSTTDSPEGAELSAPASACVELTKADVEILRDGISRLPFTPKGSQLYKALDSLYRSLEIAGTV